MAPANTAMISIRQLLFSLAALLFCMPAAFGTEEDFVYVTTMPPARGELRDAVSRIDEGSGLTFTKQVYVVRAEDLYIVTHVATASCADGAGSAVAVKPFIMAIQYLPTQPQTFSAAGLHDLFKEVYVRDLDGKIRLYEDMHGTAMGELTDRFKPVCQET